MFIENKYTKIYYQIINRAIDRDLSGYSERHHIIPKSLGGSEENSNKIFLTAREHLLCHLLLTKMVIGEAIYKMHWALSFMQCGSKIFHSGRMKSTSRVYEQARLKFVEMLKKPKSEEHKTKISIALKGHKVSQNSIDKLIERNKSRICTDETRLKMSLASKGKPKSEETRKRMSKPKEKKRPPITEETRLKMSDATKGKPKSEETRKRMSEASRDYMKDGAWKQSHALAMKARSGKIRITNGVQNKIVSQEEYDDLYPSWNKGITHFKNK
jgi:hypothetical protein